MTHTYVRKPTAVAEAIQLKDENSDEICNLGGYDITKSHGKWSFRSKPDDQASNGDYLVVEDGKTFFMSKKEFEATFQEDRSAY